MRVLHRAIAAGALGLPLMFGGAGMALAGGPFQIDHEDQFQHNHVDPVAVSGQDNHVKVKPSNEQAASSTNQDEETSAPPADN